MKKGFSISNKTKQEVTHTELQRYMTKKIEIKARESIVNPNQLSMIEEESKRNESILE